ncbi:proline dehydrogenase family protein, partial [Clavibacter michiganensis]|uniref:proline dehydrogenase family protein n=1 Tax=Clavibacter michiganensis TaxID=28447 RepID=UPI00293092A3
MPAWAQERGWTGAAPSNVRNVKGANLALDQVGGRKHDWPGATWATKEQTDAHDKGMLGHALQTAAADAVKVGVAGHNLSAVSDAWLLAEERRVTDAMACGMPAGMGAGHGEAGEIVVGVSIRAAPVWHT